MARSLPPLVLAGPRITPAGLVQMGIFHLCGGFGQSFRALRGLGAPSAAMAFRNSPAPPLAVTIPPMSKLNWRNVLDGC